VFGIEQKADIDMKLMLTQFNDDDAASLRAITDAPATSPRMN
jgi:hypothetical protein